MKRIYSMTIHSFCSRWTADVGHLLSWSCLASAKTFAHAESLMRWPGMRLLKAGRGDEVNDLDREVDAPYHEKDGQEAPSGKTGNLHVVCQIPLAPSQGRPRDNCSDKYRQKANTEEQ